MPRCVNGEGGPEAGALGSGAVGVAGCARLRYSAAGMRSKVCVENRNLVRIQSGSAAERSGTSNFCIRFSRSSPLWLYLSSEEQKSGDSRVHQSYELICSEKRA